MIAKLDNFTNKSFKDYSNPSDLRFGKNNIIFGYNGRGKSTLASGIVEMYTSTKSEDGCRFFNRDYVNESLLLQDSGEHKRIKGVIANFGKKDADLETKIQELETKLANTDALIKEHSKTLSKNEERLRKQINSIHDRRKGDTKIVKKPKDEDILKTISLYHKDLERALEKEPDKTKLSKATGDSRYTEAIAELETITVEPIDAIEQGTFSKIEEISRTKYSTESIPAPAIVDWLNEGLRVHSQKNLKECIFCGHRIDIETIQNKIELYNTDKIQKDALILRGFYDSLNKIILTTKDNLKTFPQIERILGKKLDEAKTRLDKILPSVEAFAILSLQKAEDMANIVLRYVDTVEDGIIEISNIFNVIRQSITEELSSLRQKESVKDILVKGAIGFEIEHDNNIQSQIAEIQKLRGEIESTKAKSKAIRSKIKTLTEQKGSTSDFAFFITNILSDLGMRFKVVPDSSNHNYVISLIDSDLELAVSDISEGKKNILALLFFYYELFTDKCQQNFKDEIELIVIDDPITSLDEINHMYILNLIEQVLSIESPQVFILTHIWDDICTLGYKFKHNDTKNNYLEIKKDLNGNSYLTNLRNTISPYNHHFAEVYDFSKKNLNDELSDCDIYHMPNTIRLVLEDFLSNKIKKSSPTKSNEIEIAKVLFNKEWTDITENEKTKLGELLLVINFGSHQVSRNPEQVQRAAKFLMKRI